MKRVSSLDALVKDDAVLKAKGPVAAIIAEDAVEVAATLRHHAERGFRTLILFAPAEMELDPEAEAMAVVLLLTPT